MARSKAAAVTFVRTPTRIVSENEQIDTRNRIVYVRHDVEGHQR